MICFECGSPASVKRGTAKGNALSVFLPKKILNYLKWKTWDKIEFYLCRRCYESKKGV